MSCTCETGADEYPYCSRDCEDRDEARTGGDQEWVAAEEAVLNSLQRGQVDEGWAR